LGRPSTPINDIFEHEAVLADVKQTLTACNDGDFVSGLRQLAGIDRTDDASAVDQDFHERSRPQSQQRQYRAFNAEAG